jgi:hypothetical protein
MHFRMFPLRFRVLWSTLASRKLLNFQFYIIRVGPCNLMPVIRGVFTSVISVIVWNFRNFFLRQFDLFQCFMYTAGWHSDRRSSWYAVGNIFVPRRIEEVENRRSRAHKSLILPHSQAVFLGQVLIHSQDGFTKFIQMQCPRWTAAAHDNTTLKHTCQTWLTTATFLPLTIVSFHLPVASLSVG